MRSTPEVAIVTANVMFVQYTLPQLNIIIKNKKLPLSNVFCNFMLFAVTKIRVRVKCFRVFFETCLTKT